MQLQILGQRQYARYHVLQAHRHWLGPARVLSAPQALPVLVDLRLATLARLENTALELLQTVHLSPQVVFFPTVIRRSVCNRFVY